MSAPVCTIAVIVPVHNAAKYLRIAWTPSRPSQFDEFCCVLVDDGSRDESPLLCDNMAAGDARFTVIHQPQRGVSAARTAGLRGHWRSGPSGSRSAMRMICTTLRFCPPYIRRCRRPTCRWPAAGTIPLPTPCPPRPPPLPP